MEAERWRQRDWIKETWEKIVLGEAGYYLYDNTVNCCCCTFGVRAVTSRDKEEAESETEALLSDSDDIILRISNDVTLSETGW